MQKNNLFTIGEVDEVITEENLRCAYGVGVKIIRTEKDDGTSVRSCLPVLG